jgi:beta-lactamase class A
MDDQRDVLTLLETVFGEASLNGSLHALDIDGVAEIRYRSDEVRHSASTGKVPILVALMRAVAVGDFSLLERVRIPAGRGCTAGVVRGDAHDPPVLVAAGRPG